MKFAICNKSTLAIAACYDSDKIEQGTNKFGGPWNDPNQFIHIMIPNDLESENITELEAYEGDVALLDDCGCVCKESVVIKDENGNPIMKPAFDEHDQPILDADGEQISIPLTRKLPILIQGIGIRKKS